MLCRQVGAVFLALLVACGGNRPALRAPEDPNEAMLAAARYELSVLLPGTGDTEPVEVDSEQFTRALARLVREVKPAAQPLDAAARLFQLEREVEFLARVEDGRIVRMVPLEEAHPPTQAQKELTREYLVWCQRTQGGGDCLGLLKSGPVLGREGRYALALALGGVLEETKRALRESVEPRAVLATLVGALLMYLLLWVVPEPVSKGVAAVLTVGLLAWLGVDAVWGLMGGWMRLVREADRATTFAQLREIGEQYGGVMGQNTARVLVLLVTAALGGTASAFASKLPKLPGHAQAVVQAEAQGGVRLGAVAEVELVAASSEGAFSVLMRSPGGRGGATGAGSGQGLGTTLIRHLGGNRQVILNGQRWHVPANKSLKDVPRTDPMGDRLQEAALQAAQRWSPASLSTKERRAIQEAREMGEHWRAHLLERQARGRFVEGILKQQFRKHLDWNPTGVDAVDPITGYEYELLSGTASNMALHGQRMSDVLFRMITF